RVSQSAAASAVARLMTRPQGRVSVSPWEGMTSDSQREHAFAVGPGQILLHRTGRGPQALGDLAVAQFNQVRQQKGLSHLERQAIEHAVDLLQALDSHQPRLRRWGYFLWQARKSFEV